MKLFMVQVHVLITGSFDRAAFICSVALSVDFFVGFVSAHLANGVLEHDVLLEQIVYGGNAAGVVVHGALEVERHPCLYTLAAGSGCQVCAKHEIEHQRGGQDGVAAEEVNLDLHTVFTAHPSEDVEVVPAFLVVAAGRIIVDADFMEDVGIEVGLLVLVENGVDDGQLADFLGLEVLGSVEHFAVAIAQNVGGEPAGQA